ncbi:MAG: tetratricopeptide repeat protein, partial [Candidatus Zixiibacteriota bacterium]
SLFGALLIAALSVQSVQLYRGLALPGAYLKQHNQDLSELIDSHAVVTGPYTPALTIDNELRGVIYMFGLTNVEKDLFQRFPITHVAVDRTNWNLALRDFPFLKPARKLAEMSVRDQVIALFRVPGADAPETDFERGVAFFDQGVYDSALTLFERFSSEYPENLHGKLRIISTRATQGDLASALTELGRILGEHPDNYMLHAFADGFYRNAHRITRDGQYQRLALFHRLKAQALNRKVALSP